MSQIKQLICVKEVNQNKLIQWLKNESMHWYKMNQSIRSNWVSPLSQNKSRLIHELKQVKAMNQNEKALK